MLIQAAWNCGVWEMGILVFNFPPEIFVKIFGTNIAAISWGIFINCYAIFTCAILPTVHLIYNKKSRDALSHVSRHWLNVRTGHAKNKIATQGF